MIVAGDTFSTIAKKTGVSVKAIKEANAGLDDKKLQIGHKLQIPASAAVATAEAPKAAARPLPPLPATARLTLSNPAILWGKSPPQTTPRLKPSRRSTT